MREKLIELISQMESHPEITCPRPQGSETCKGCKYAVNENFCDMNARKADYLLANGVIVPPCKVGDPVYSPQIDMRFDAVITEIRITDTDIFFEWVQYEKSAELTELWDEGYFVLEDFGKTVFLTREEALNALREHNNATD